MSPPKKRSSEPGFEAALKRLEEIVAALEQGDRPLDDSLRLFEEGIALTRRCASHLDQAQRRIEVLTREADGTPGLRPFEPDAAPRSATAGEDDGAAGGGEEDAPEDDDAPGRGRGR